MKSWRDLTEYQRADVSKRFQNYLRVYLCEPLPAEIYIPVLPDPFGLFATQVSELPGSAPMQKAVFKRIIYPNNSVSYKFTEIR